VAPKALIGILAKLRPETRPGSEGESVACRYLEGRGYRVLCRNYRCRSGEIDIVARDAFETTVFVEVKDRRVASHGEGYEAVTFGKRRRVVRAARIFAAAHGLSERPLRFDVVSISWRGGEPEIRHDPGAFDSEGA
jgi:putative endonuclease